MNTGVQRSGATPPAARTANTKPVGDEPGNVFGQGKSAPLIAMAHEIPYVATATVADLHDLEHKVERAMEFRGARYLHVLVPCPLGWGSAVGHDQDRAPRTRDRPLPRVRGGARRGRRRVEDPRAGSPSRSTCGRSDGSRTCSASRPGPTSSNGSRPVPTANIRRFGLADLEEDADGEAVRDHAGRRLEPRQQDGLLADRAPRLRRPAAAVRTPARPARTYSNGSTTPRRAATATSGLAPDHGGQPLPGRDGQGLLPPVRDAPATAPTLTSPSGSTRSSGSWVTRRSRRAGASRSPRRLRASASSSSAQGRPGSPPPTTSRVSDTP